MASALVFVLAPESQLPGDGASWSDLVKAQALGLRSGVTLRIFPAPADTDHSLENLINQGQADIRGAYPFNDIPGRPLCDALVPHIDPRSLGIGVYELNGQIEPESENALQQSVPGLVVGSIRCLDRFALKDAENETCWFYPTESGNYLSWENRRRLKSEPGFLPEVPPQAKCDYQREDIHVLWSLMADDLALTCVGLTYAKRRIEWPLLHSEAEECATWTSFCIDPMAESSFAELSCVTVFGSESKN